MRASLLLCALLPVACTISDEDRCLAGHTYDPAAHSCRENVEAGTVDQRSGDGQPGDGQPGDAQAKDATTMEAGGFGSACRNKADCKTDADYCTYNDFTKSGVCTFSDCTADSCPAPTSCCDCTAIGMPSICGPAEALGVFCKCGG